jgi:hypothetical protein
LNENVPLKLHSNEIPHGKQQHKAVKKINYLGGKIIKNKEKE